MLLTQLIVEDLRAAFWLDLHEMAARGETARWPLLVEVARQQLVECPQSHLKETYAQLVAADALIHLATSTRKPDV